MKKFDLNEELKKLRVPEPGEDYWKAFPKRVLKESHRDPPARRAAESLRPRLAWGLGVAFACFASVFCLAQSRLPQHLYYSAVKREQDLRQTVRQFPAHVCALMQDEHGMWQAMEEQQ